MIYRSYAAKTTWLCASSVFRTTQKDELSKNPFRVFTSMLAADDPRFFTPELQERLQGFIDKRSIFSDELVAMANKAAENRGLEEQDADKFIEQATAAFELNDEPIRSEERR